MPNSRKASIHLVQQGIWDMPLESMPLAAGYLKATALADREIRDAVDIRIHNFRGGVGLTEMAAQIFADDVPDVLAFSVLGWNYRAFGTLAETFKQLNPDGWSIMGGTHVTDQAERVFQMFPNVDVVVNGEGELAFRELLRAHFTGRDVHALDGIAGVSYRNAAGAVSTTPARARLQDLDAIPSPFLTGALDLTNDDGEFRYDVALMETNRGCPYKCSFCFWGAAVGQRVQAFSRQRLRQELELFGRLKVHAIVLCDANFGMLPIDREFVEDLIEVRDTYGYPRALETSWAKNKSKVFLDIVRRMKQTGLRSSFTLALQTLDEGTLELMNRRNMKLNEWEDLIAWLDREGLDCYGELLWGAPGETVESFMAGYDRLARRVSRIAVYPMLILPNTQYWEKSEQFGVVSVRGDQDDFQHILSHHTMTLEENKRVHRFIFWSRTVAENAIFRYLWPALRELGGITQSQVLRSIDDWIVRTDDQAAAVIRQAVARSFGDYEAVGAALAYLRGTLDGRWLLNRWWIEVLLPSLPPDVADVLDEVFNYDSLTQPVYYPEGTDRRDRLPVVRLLGDKYFVRTGIPVRYDVPTIVGKLRAGERPDLTPSPDTIDLYYRTGFENFAASTNHEETVYFLGMTLRELEQSAGVTNGVWPAASDGPRGPSGETQEQFAKGHNGECTANG